MIENSLPDTSPECGLKSVALYKDTSLTPFTDSRVTLDLTTL